MSFQQTGTVQVTGEQCQRKWLKLEQKYKEVVDTNRQTGRARKDWKFLDDMADCLGHSPNINPVYTIDTSCSIKCSEPSSSSSCSVDGSLSSDEDAEECDGTARKLTARRQRKRKNYSSASEMLTFLEKYSEKREEAEEKKFELLNKIHEEKKEFFSEFLKVIKNSNK